MIKDVSGICLTPGNFGKDCLGNGEHIYKFGGKIMCCCDECDYLICCLFVTDCIECCDNDCPRRNNKKIINIILQFIMPKNMLIYRNFKKICKNLFLILIWLLIFKIYIIIYVVLLFSFGFGIRKSFAKAVVWRN